MSGRQWRGRRGLKRRAQKTIKKMPRSRMGDDVTEYLLRVERWLKRIEREAAGDQELLDKIADLAGQTMKKHIARRLQASVITTPAADELMSEVGVSPETVANAHFRRHRASSRDHSCVPLGPRGEETVVVSYSSEEARTRIWRLGEGTNDPDPKTVEGWRREPRR